MTIGNFSPVLGSTGSDSLEANNLEIVYGLGGNDNLLTNANFAPEEFSILVGGAGDDVYSVPAGTSAVIFDNGLSEDSDTIVFGGTSASTSLFTTVDNNTHLYIVDPDTESNLLILNYLDIENRIETFEYADGTIFGNELSALGDLEDVDIPLEQILVDSESEEPDTDAPEPRGTSLIDAIGSLDPPTEPEEEPPSEDPATEPGTSFLGGSLIDFNALGLSADTLEEDIEELIATDINFENTVIATDDGSQPDLAVTGSLEESDDSYTYNGGEYFFDLYSLDPEVYPEGNEVEVELSSSSFGTTVFLLDSRGDVVEFASDSDGFDDSTGNSVTNLSFTVPSNEPLFVSVESIAPEVVGSYDLSIAGGVAGETVPDETVPDENDAPVPGTIQINDSLTGEITTEDQDFTFDGNRFFTDLVDITGDTPGEVRVSLESDFDGVLFVGEVDEENNTREIFNIDEFIAGGTESGTFIFDPNLDYRVFVDTFEPEATGNYTLTTELISETDLSEEVPTEETVTEEIVPEEINPETDDISGEFAIQTTDSLTGDLTIDDEAIDTDNGLFYSDILFFEGDMAGEIEVTLESDFDALLFLSPGVDESGELADLITIDDRFAGGIEEGTFTFEPGVNAGIIVTSFDPEDTGSYILSTEFLG